MSITATSGGSAATSAQQLRGVARLREHVDAIGGEQPGEALADDDCVVGEDHPHGIVAVRWVPWPAGLSMWRLPSRASTRSRSPRSPGASGVGAADAVVGDLHGQLAVRARDVDGRAGGVGVLGDVGERLGGDEVGRRFDGCGEAVGVRRSARRGRACAG